MTDRLPTELWVTATLRQCAAKAIPVYITHKGAPASGTVIVRIVMQGKGSKLLNQARNIDDELGWMDPFEGEIVDEKRADQYIERAVARDPDVWVVEVEDNNGKNPFEGKVF